MFFSKSRYKILGQGTFGMVVEPALPNKNKADFPGKVTKIMSQKENYNKTVKISKNIKKKVPELHIPVNTYKKKPYRLNNINNSKLREKVKEFLERAHGEGANTFYPLRMDTLGTSFADIARDPALLKKAREIPREVLCQQILKLMNIVKSIKDAGFIHADIRETNVLFNLEKQTMTIIDFDWFRNFEDYIAEYPVYFYSHPPEELFFIEFDVPGKSLPGIHAVEYLYKRYNGMNDIDKKDFFETKFISEIKQIVNKTMKYIRIPYPNKEDVIRGAIEFMANAIDIVELGEAESIVKLLEQVQTHHTLPTVDSFGLGVALFHLLRDLLKEEEPMEAFIFEELLPAMCEPHPMKRVTIEGCIEGMKAFMRKQGFDFKGLDEDPMDAVTAEFSRMSLMNTGVAAAGVAIPNAGNSLKEKVVALAGATTMAERTAALPALPASGPASPAAPAVAAVAASVAVPSFPEKSKRQPTRRSNRIRERQERHSKKA